MIDRILFRGGAWGIISYFGAISAIREEIARSDSVVRPDVKLYGCSAGALVSLFYVLGLTNEEMIETCERFAEQAHTKLMNFDGLDLAEYNATILCRLIERFPDAFERANRAGMRVGVATEDGFRFIGDFESNYDLANTMMCSYHMPGLSTYDAKIGDRLALDGEFCDMCEHFSGPDSLSIGAYQTDVDIAFDLPKIWCATVPPDYVSDMFYGRGIIRTKKMFDTIRTGLPIQPHAPKSYIDLYATNAWWSIRRIQRPTITQKQLEHRVRVAEQSSATEASRSKP